MAAAVRLDKLQAIKGGNIESVQASVDLDNGSVVVMGGLVAGTREVFSASAPTDVTKDYLVFVASPEVVYESAGLITDFVNKANKPARAYHLNIGDVVTITDDGIDGTTVVDQYLIPANGEYKLNAAADLIGGTRLALQVIKKTTLYGKTATQAKVIKV